MNTRTIIALIIVLLILIGGFFLIQEEQAEPVVLSFEDCVEAGYPVMESFPRQCATPDGRTYAEEIPVSPTYDNASADLIRVETPFPGAVTGKTFSVMGEARGTWYFEASFPIELLDADGNVLATAIAQAKTDWMTEDFVPFNVEVAAPESYIGPATLVLKRDNPSGLPEHDRSISIPITVEY